MQKTRRNSRSSELVIDSILIEPVLRMSAHRRRGPNKSTLSHTSIYSDSYFPELRNIGDGCPNRVNPVQFFCLAEKLNGEKCHARSFDR